MNMNTNMLRANPMGQTPAMLAMSGAGPFLQNPAQINQQQLGQSPMNMPTSINSNAAMGMLPTSSMPLQQNPRFVMQGGQPQQLPHGQQQGRPMMRPGQGPQPMLPTGNATGALHMGSMNPQMQNVGFPGQGMSNQPPVGANTIRRAPSQSHLVPPNMNPAVTGGMGLSMNPQQMPPHMQQLRLQQQQHQQQQRMAAARQVANGQIINPGMGGGGQSQIMSSLQHPGSMGPQPHPMFPNGVPMPNQQPQMAHSPRPNSLPPNALGMAPGPSQIPGNRGSMTPDNPGSINFVNYPGSQFSAGGGMGSRAPPQSGQYPFQPPSTPPMQETPDSPLNVINQGTPNSQPRTGFQPTPAQQLQMSNVNPMNQSNTDPFGGQHFPMPPPSVIPPRPPSLARSMTPHLMGPQMQHPPPQASQPPQQVGTPAAHSSPLPSGPSDQPSHPTRPQSRPQSQPQHHPNSQLQNQGAPSRSGTPRSAHPSLPPTNGALQPHQTGRIPPPPPPNQRQQSHTPVSALGPQVPSNMLPTQQQQPGMVGHQPSAQPQPPQNGLMGGRQPPPNSIPIPPPVVGVPPLSRNQQSMVVGNGQGVVRLLQFSGMLSSESEKDQKLQLSFWNEVVREFFTPKAVMKLMLWKDNQKNEAKPFEIGLPIIPRFFLVTAQSGVKSMSLALDGARERLYAQGHAIVECVAAVWTYRYNNGYTVTLRGPLSVHVVVTAATPTPTSVPNQSGYVLKFEEFEFDVNHYDKYISIGDIEGARVPELSKTLVPMLGQSGHSLAEEKQLRLLDEYRVGLHNASIPMEPVNAFGIPQATMRCLELAESVGAMADLIAFANETGAGPLDALSKFAAKLRENGVTLNSQGGPGHQPIDVQNGTGPYWPPHPQPPMPQPPPPQQLMTLYSSAPPSVTNLQPPNLNQTIPPPSQAHISSPRNTPSAANSPQKQHKSISQNAAASTSSGSAASPSMSSGATNTPSLSNASLKRKQTSDTSSPTTANAEGPPAKRSARKRGRTNTTGAG